MVVKSHRQLVRVQCIDYGKRVVVDVSDLAVIDDIDHINEGNDDDGGDGEGNTQHAKYFAVPGLAVECCLAFLAPPPSPPMHAVDDGHDNDGTGGGGQGDSGDGDGGEGYTLAVAIDEDNDNNHNGDDNDDGDNDADGDASMSGYQGMLAMSNRAIEMLGDEAWGKYMTMQVRK